MYYFLNIVPLSDPYACNISAGASTRMLRAAGVHISDGQDPTYDEPKHLLFLLHRRCRYCSLERLLLPQLELGSELVPPASVFTRRPHLSPPHKMTMDFHRHTQILGMCTPSFRNQPNIPVLVGSWV
jgi:hypothetical protein